MLLYEPNAVLGIRSWSHFFYQCAVQLLCQKGFGPIVVELETLGWTFHTKPVDNEIHVCQCCEIFASSFAPSSEICLSFKHSLLLGS